MSCSFFLVAAYSLLTVNVYLDRYAFKEDADTRVLPVYGNAHLESYSW